MTKTPLGRIKTSWFVSDLVVHVLNYGF